MSPLRATRTITAAPDAVWDQLASTRHWPTWAPFYLPVCALALRRIAAAVER